MYIMAILAATSLMMATALENNSTILDNILGNTTPMNNSANISATNNTTNPIVFVIGEATGGNKSAFELGSPIQQTRDASDLWYLIQAKPHGYV
jgi:hypothetical protein